MHIREVSGVGGSGFLSGLGLFEGYCSFYLMSLQSLGFEYVGKVFLLCLLELFSVELI